MNPSPSVALLLLCLVAAQFLAFVYFAFHYIADLHRAEHDLELGVLVHLDLSSNQIVWAPDHT